MESKPKPLLLSALKVSQSRRRLAGYVFYPVVVEAAPPFVRAHATCGGQSSINLHASSMHKHSPNTAAVLPTGALLSCVVTHCRLAA